MKTMPINLSYYSVEANGTLMDAALAISKNKSRCVVVIDQGKVIGVISEGDLVRALLRGTDITAPMREFVHHGFMYLEKKDLGAALALFHAHGISLIPVLDQALVLKDVITLNDMLTHVKLDDTKGGA